MKWLTDHLKERESSFGDDFRMPWTNAQDCRLYERGVLYDHMEMFPATAEQIASFKGRVE